MNKTTDKRQIILLTLVIILFCVHMALAIMNARAFYLDGAYFFIKCVNNFSTTWPHFDDFQRNRLFTNLFNQLPVSFALLNNITNLTLLKIIFSAPLFLNSIFIVIFTGLICRWRNTSILVFLFSLASFVFFSLPSEVFIVNPAYTATPFYWLLLAFIFSKENPRPLDFAVVVLVCIFCFKSHENSMIACPILCLTSLGLALKSKSRLKSTFLWVIAILCFFATIYNIYWQYTSPDKSVSNGYVMQFFKTFTFNNFLNSNLYFSVVGCLLFIFVIFNIKTRKSIHVNLPLDHYRLRFIESACLCAFVFFPIMFFFNKPRFNPFIEHEFRVFITFGITALLPLCVYLLFKGFSLNPQQIKAMVYILFLTAICHYAWQIRNDIYWIQFVERVNSVKDSSGSSIINPKDTIGSESPLIEEPFAYGWTWPSLGLALQNSPIVRNVISPTSYLEYFKINDSKSSINIPFASVNNKVFKFKFVSGDVSNNLNHAATVTNREFAPRLIKGFSGPEDWGFWTDGRLSEFTIEIASQQRPVSLHLSARAYLNQAHRTQRVGIYINSNLLKSFTLSYPSESISIDIPIPPNLLDKSRTQVFTIDLPDAISPAELGLSSDNRALALAITKLEIKYND